MKLGHQCLYGGSSLRHHKVLTTTRETFDSPEVWSDTIWNTLHTVGLNSKSKLSGKSRLCNCSNLISAEKAEYFFPLSQDYYREFPCFFLYIILVLRFLQMPCYYRHEIIPNMTIWVKQIEYLTRHLTDGCIGTDRDFAGNLNFLSQENGRRSSVWVLLRLASTSPADSAVLLLITYHICSSVPGLLCCHQNYNIITTLQMDTLIQRRTLEHLERTN